MLAPNGQNGKRNKTKMENKQNVMVAEEKNLFVGTTTSGENVYIIYKIINNELVIIRSFFTIGIE